MNLVSLIQSLPPGASTFLIQKGKRAIEVVTTEAAKTQILSLVNHCVWGTALAAPIEFTFPYLAEKTKDVALKWFEGSCPESLQVCFGDFYSDHRDFLLSVAQLARSSPTELAISHATYFLKQSSLEYVCGKVGKISHSYFGSIAYGVTAPIIAPSVSPLTTARGNVLLKCALHTGQKALSLLNQETGEKEGIELDDLSFAVIEFDSKEEEASDDEFVLVDENEILKI